MMFNAASREAKLARWGPRSQSREGRFRTGGSSNFKAPGFSPDKESIETRRRTSSRALP